MGNASLWYDPDGDMIEILWSFGEGSYSPTDDGRNLKHLDEDGNVTGFLIRDFSSFKGPSPLEFELGPERPSEDVANVTVAMAAWDLDISPQRMRRLIREGGMRGAQKVDGTWLIPTPIEVLPGKRGPVGVAGART